MPPSASTKILGLGAVGIRTLTYLHERDLRKVSLIGIDMASSAQKVPGPDHRISLVPMPPADGLDEAGFQLTTLLQQEVIEELFDEPTVLVLLVGDLAETFVMGAVSVIAQLAHEKDKKVLMVPTAALLPHQVESPQLDHCDGLLLATEPAPEASDSSPSLSSESTLQACANRVEMLLEICQPLYPNVSVDFQDLFHMLKKSKYFVVASGTGRDENRDEQAMQDVLEQLPLERHPTLSWKNALIMLIDSSSKPATMGEQRRIFISIEKLFMDRRSQLKFIKIGSARDTRLAGGLKVSLLLTAQPTPATE